jgi:hypothetical protein
MFSAAIYALGNVIGMMLSGLLWLLPTGSKIHEFAGQWFKDSATNWEKMIENADKLGKAITPEDIFGENGEKGGGAAGAVAGGLGAVSKFANAAVYGTAAGWQAMLPYQEQVLVGIADSTRRTADATETLVGKMGGVTNVGSVKFTENEQE